MLRHLLPLLCLTACLPALPDDVKDGVDATGGDSDGDGVRAADGDCDDGDPTVYPGATEVCDGLDQDCDAVADNGALTTFYADVDADGYGTEAETRDACDAPDGFASVSGDCDDQDATIHPGAEETCAPTDDDCDGATDDITLETTWYRDADEDGYGDPAVTLAACDAPAGYVTDATDCADSDLLIFPGADEQCDGVDEDCDGDVDESATDAPTWYADADGDGFGDADAPIDSCSVPAGYTADATDCDNTSSSAWPGVPEACDTVDTDCDGDVADSESVDAPTWYPDADGDGFGDESLPQRA